MNAAFAEAKAVEDFLDFDLKLLDDNQLDTMLARCMAEADDRQDRKTQALERIPFGPPLPPDYKAPPKNPNHKKKTCNVCLKKKSREAFSARQWTRKSRQRRRCKACVKARQERLGVGLGKDRVKARQEAELTEKLEELELQASDSSASNVTSDSDVEDVQARAEAPRPAAVVQHGGGARRRSPAHEEEARAHLPRRPSLAVGMKRHRTLPGLRVGGHAAAKQGREAFKKVITNNNVKKIAQRRLAGKAPVVDLHDIDRSELDNDLPTVTRRLNEMLVGQRILFVTGIGQHKGKSPLAAAFVNKMQSGENGRVYELRAVTNDLGEFNGRFLVTKTMRRDSSGGGQAY